MKFDQLFGGSMPKNVHLSKISSQLQFAAEIWALQVLISLYKPFLTSNFAIVPSV